MIDIDHRKQLISYLCACASTRGQNQLSHEVTEYRVYIHVCVLTSRIYYLLYGIGLVGYERIAVYHANCT